jgi:amidase
MTSTLSASDVDRILALDAMGQAALVREREVTAEDLLWVTIDRIERVNPALNAVVIKAYDAAERAVNDGLPPGPFTGVPYLLKDLGLEAAGMPLHEGSVYLKDYVSDRDSTIVTRLRAAGLVILGRTGSCELGMKPPATRGTSRAAPVGRAADRQPPSPAAWYRWPEPTTPVARSGSRRPRAGSSG